MNDTAQFRLFPPIIWDLDSTNLKHILQSCSTSLTLQTKQIKKDNCGQHIQVGMKIKNPSTLRQWRGKKQILLMLTILVIITVAMVMILNNKCWGEFKISEILRIERQFVASETSSGQVKKTKFSESQNVQNSAQISDNNETNSVNTNKTNQQNAKQIVTKEEQFTVFKYKFELLTNLEEKCKRNASVDVVFLIVSFIKTYDRRMAIRQTWGLESHIKDAKIRRVFLMGIDPKNDSVRRDILRENEQHHDIVLADYADTYENNTIKYIMGIQWARKFCSNSKFYVIADDDAFFSVKNLLKYLRDIKIHDNIAKFQNIYLNTSDQQNHKFLFYGGYKISGVGPMREGKWKATLEQYAYDVYPAFITGHTVILSNDILDVLVDAAHYTKFFWIDDVYLGMLANWADVTPTHVNHIEVGHPNDIEIFDTTIASHYMPSAAEAIRIWNLLNDRGNA
ncbi:hypothetical protein B566_EDAN010123 [Ephemera danica]|nr:hypothetical protein B566_EDAN010123 [Ephemera danica]